MKILQVSGKHYSLETSKIINRGGKHESHVILPYMEPLKLYTEEELRKYKWVKVWVGSRASLFLKTLKELLLSDYDVLVFHGCTLSVRLAPFFEYKFVRKIRGRIPIVFVCHSQNRVKYILREKIHKLARKDRNLLIAYVSTNMKRYLPEKSVYLPQAIPGTFRPNPRIRPDNPPVILCPTAGGKWGEKYKGRRFLLEAVKKLKEKGLAFRLKELGGKPVPYSQMPEQYWKSTLVFDQIYDEVYGKVTPEAFMCGRVALNDAGYPTEDNFVNAENLADKIEEFLVDENLRRKVAEKGRKIVLERHLAENATRRFIEVLKKFVEGCS